jgi:hypothetical protein
VDPSAEEMTAPSPAARKRSPVHATVSRFTSTPLAPGDQLFPPSVDTCTPPL